MRKRLCLYLLLLAVLTHGQSVASEPRYDFRVVIDVSGSMKQTDPQNLRVPALKLLNGLIPTGSRAGVWTFGRYVDMTVKWGKVNNAWRKQADLGASRIHSNALLTNIESALARARVGWDKADPKTRRILLLLTDGKVDISKDPAKNEKSRHKVLSESLDALKKAGAEIHAIALSSGTDEVLLKQLALETNGSFAVTHNADELQKVFFKMFERASKPDTVALQGKEFPVDASIKEMTLLIFRSADSQPTILIPPDSPAISAFKKRGTRWRSDKGYDLITIENPEAGTWRIDAELDPDNRLMVVTDLKLKVDGMPAYATPREAFQISAELFNRDKKISKNSFLRFIDFEVTHVDEDDAETSHALIHTTVREDKGQYLYPVDQKLAEGTHSFVVSADSRTFNRSKRFDMQVQWPVEVSIEAQKEAGIYELKLRAREEYLKPDGLVADVNIEAPDGTHDSLELESDSGWLKTIVETNQAGLYRAHIKVSAQTHATEIRDIDLGTFSMLGTYRETPGAKKDTAAQDTVVVEPAKPEGINWKLVGVVIVVVNLSLLLLLIFGWWLLKRKKDSPEIVLEDEEVGA
ncbi:MAG: VWA domain-containing protein [Gammaproteobacteria bacterium]|nr:VWA domain-containing protein [Gammaproteobacteria bacterium]